MAINNHYLDFVQKGDLISLVNDYHLDNNLKEMYNRLDCKQSMQNVPNIV